MITEIEIKSHQFLLQRNDRLFASTINDELVMMDDDEACYYGLNATARTIWELLDTPLTGHQLLTELSTRFDASVDTIATDITPFISTMIQQKLIIQAVNQ